jgi:predicted phage terminase large subunit-like protein
VLPAELDDPVADLAALMVAATPERLEAFASELAPDQLQLLEHAMAEHLAAGWRASPATMAAHLDPQGFQSWRYLRFLAKAFVRATTGESPRQIWNLPSRMGKTTLLRWGVTWGLDLVPRSRWIWTTYGDRLAHESAVAIRDLLRMHSDVLRAELRADRQKADRFVTDEGGGLLGAGINASIVGFGCGDGGGLIIDDPMKNWQEAHSETARQRVFDQYLGTLRHRLDQESAPIIVCHARWHEDDLSGRLIQSTVDETGEDWEVVALPAIAVGGDPLGREPGEVLEQERMSLESVKARHHAMGSYLTAALEQQEPAPPEGKELLREWFVIGDQLPEAPDRAITSWDLKLKDNERGDYVVGQCWWTVAGGFWLMDQVRGQFDHATTANAIALLSVRHPEAREHHIEAAGAAPEVMATLRKPQTDYVVSDAMARRLAMSPDERDLVAQHRRRGMANLLPNPARGDKSVRARTYIAPEAESGHVRFPADATWLPALMDELAAFPEAAHNDQVDAMSQALQKIGRGAATAKAAQGSLGTPGAAARAASSQLGGTPPPRPAGRARASAPRGAIRRS